MVRLSDKQFESIYSQVQMDTREQIDHIGSAFSQRSAFFAGSGDWHFQSSVTA
jgi:hypothetical protein